MVAGEQNNDIKETRDVDPYLIPLTLINAEIRSLDAIIDVFSHDSLYKSINIDDNVRKVSLWMIQAVGSSSRTLVNLIKNKDMSVRDCYMIARSIVETSINICYIISSGKSAAERAIRHADQRAFRDLNREDNVAGWSVKIKSNFEIEKEHLSYIRDSIDEFSGKNGKEIFQWDQKSIDEKIDFISQKNLTLENKCDISLSLLAAYTTIYRKSSEILHGSFFGVRFFWMPTPPLDAKNMTSTM